MDKLFLHHLLKRLFDDPVPDYESMVINVVLRSLARKNDKRAALMEFHCPDDWVLNIDGDMTLRDVYVALRVPREIVDEFARAKVGVQQSADEAVSLPESPSGPAAE